MLAELTAEDNYNYESLFAGPSKQYHVIPGPREQNKYLVTSKKHSEL
jgi:hypothetical protein